MGDLVEQAQRREDRQTHLVGRHLRRSGVPTASLDLLREQGQGVLVDRRPPTSAANDVTAAIRLRPDRAPGGPAGPGDRMTVRGRCMVGLGMSAVPVLSGCALLLSDPPPPPEIAPLEVVVGSSTMRDEPCLLNRDEVAAGTHEVALISESKLATVRIRSELGEVVFEGAARPQSQQSGPPEEVDQTEGGSARSVRLEQGSYAVECEPEGGPTSTAALSVAPARPGY